MRPWSTSGRLLPGLTLRRLLTATLAVRLQNKTTSAVTADNAGTPQLKQFLMVSIKEFPRGIAGVTAITKCSIGHPNGLSFGSTPPALDQVISNPEARTAAGACTWSGPQATSSKRQAFEPTCSSIKRQASSPKLQASSVKPQAASSLILDPRNMDIGEVLEEQGPRVFAKINVL